MVIVSHQQYVNSSFRLSIKHADHDIKGTKLNTTNSPRAGENFDKSMLDLLLTKRLLVVNVVKLIHVKITKRPPSSLSFSPRAAADV